MTKEIYKEGETKCSTKSFSLSVTEASEQASESNSRNRKYLMCNVSTPKLSLPLKLVSMQTKVPYPFSDRNGFSVLPILLDHDSVTARQLPA